MPTFNRTADLTEQDRNDEELFDFESLEDNGEGSSLFEEIDQQLAPHA